MHYVRFDQILLNYIIDLKKFFSLVCKLGDDALPSITLAGIGQLVKMPITL